MSSTHEVFCKKCGKKLAWWSGLGDNIQHENEYECRATVRLKVEPGQVHKKNGRVTKYYESACSIEHKTHYCEACARKLHYHCDRPHCHGTLRLIRRKNGTFTKYA